jgi:hypothetical protein
VAEHELDVQQTGKLEVGCEFGGARNFLCTFKPTMPYPNNAHWSILSSPLAGEVDPKGPEGSFTVAETVRLRGLIQSAIA